jgi:hypothetical protein
MPVCYIGALPGRHSDGFGQDGRATNPHEKSLHYEDSHMKKTAIAAAMVLLTIPGLAAARSSGFSIGAGLGSVGANGTTYSGWVIDGAYAIDPHGTINVDLHQDSLTGVSYRYYLDRAYNKFFIEGGILSGNGVTDPLAGAGYEFPVARQVTLRVGAGVIFDSSTTAIAFRGTVNFLP